MNLITLGNIDFDLTEYIIILTRMVDADTIIIYKTVKVLNPNI